MKNKANAASDAVPKKNNEIEDTDALSDLLAQIDTLKEEKLRTLADFQNYKRRVETERYEQQQHAGKQILNSLIELVDDFNRATSDTGDKNEILNGYEMIFEKLKSLLNEQGLIAVEVKQGDKFDPETMEAIGTAAVKKPEEDNTVVHTDGQAYKLASNNQIYRTAKVIIGKYKE